MPYTGKHLRLTDNPCGRKPPEQTSRLLVGACPERPGRSRDACAASSLAGARPGRPGPYRNAAASGAYRRLFARPAVSQARSVA